MLYCSVYCVLFPQGNIPKAIWVVQLCMCSIRTRETVQAGLSHRACLKVLWWEAEDWFKCQASMKIWCPCHSKCSAFFAWTGCLNCMCTNSKPGIYISDRSWTSCYYDTGRGRGLDWNLMPGIYNATQVCAFYLFGFMFQMGCHIVAKLSRESGSMLKTNYIYTSIQIQILYVFVTSGY